MKSLFILSLLIASPLFAQAQEPQTEQDLVEGKIQAAQALWLKDMARAVDQKQQKASALLVLVTNKLHEKGSLGSDSSRDEAEYAHVGFVARLQDIREEREAFQRKERQPDYATLQNYSKRLDHLITDLQTSLR